MDHKDCRDQRLQNDPQAARAYEQELLRRELCRQIRRLRKMRGWTQTELAEAIHTTGSAVSRLERGTHCPSLRTLDKLCTALGARLEVRLTPEG
jgi:DNA-binding XRE family transcriptional regulator